MTDEMLGITLQSSLSKNNRASAMVRLSDWKARRQEILRNMTDALNVSLSLLLDQSHADANGKPDRLVIAREQKVSLLNYLRSEFPSLWDENRVSDSDDDFTRQAALIRSFLDGSDKDMARAATTAR